jgi:hypothetical protein
MRTGDPGACFKKNRRDGAYVGFLRKVVKMPRCVVLLKKSLPELS